MPKRTRRNHGSEQKAALLKRHHVEKVPNSDLCNQQKPQPSLFYTWQRQLFENTADVFEGSEAGASAREQELHARIAQPTAVDVHGEPVQGVGSARQAARGERGRSPCRSRGRGASASQASTRLKLPFRPRA